VSRGQGTSRTTAQPPLRPGFDPGGFLKQLTAILGGGGGGGADVGSESDESSGFYDDRSGGDTSDDASVGQAPTGPPTPAAAALPDTSGCRDQDSGPHTGTDSDDAEFMEE
jgi:hypothetical protein